jgi:ABC-type amino acid transport substrate-binding protein
MRAASSVVLGSLGLAVLAVLVFGAVGTAPAAPPPPATPVELVVALHLPAPGLQVGAVRGREVVAARGLEVDVVRALARRLGVKRLRLVNVADAASLTRVGPKTWDVALAGLDARTRAGVELSVPYLRSDPVVLMRAGLPRPRSIGDLRTRLLCAVRGSGAAAVARRAHPAFVPLAADGDAELLRLVGTGRCDAAVREAPLLGAALRRLPGRYGPVGGRIETSSSWAVALPRGSTLTPLVNRALGQLRRNGTLSRIADRWLGFDPSRLRVLR